MTTTCPDGVVVGDYLEHFITRLRARPGGAGRAAMLRGLVDEAKLNLNFQLSGWDRLAWLLLSVQLELPANRLLGLFRRHRQPALKRPPAERFLETLRELIDWVGEHNAGAGLLLQIPEQRQPDASLRVLFGSPPSSTASAGRSGCASLDSKPMRGSRMGGCGDAGALAEPAVHGPVRCRQVGAGAGRDR